MGSILGILKLLQGFDFKALNVLAEIASEVSNAPDLRGKITAVVEGFKKLAPLTHTTIDDNIVAVLVTVDVPALVDAIEQLVEQLLDDNQDGPYGAAPNEAIATNAADNANAVGLPLPVLFQIAVTVVQFIRLLRNR